MFKYILSFFSVLIIASLSVKSQVADFIIPDTVCVGKTINVQNTSSGGSTYYWNFCSGDLSITPTGINFGNIGSLDRPVYSSIAKDGNDYFVFVSNNGNGSITRLAFGNNLGNTPVATNLGNFGILGQGEEGIEIKKDDVSGNWFALVVAGGLTDNLFRLNFGASLNNIPTVENLGNVGNLMNYGHTIYTFSEGGKWYSFIGNYWGNSILRLDFGNSLANMPTTISLGNIGELNGPVGFYPIQENGLWHMFVVNRDNSSLSRLDFGASLTNIPTGVNLGNALGAIYLPRSISIVRDCGQVYGFVVEEGTDAIVRLTFPNGILSIPSGIALGNIANFSFPHHISELFRIGDALYAFVMNVNSNTISRLSFASCTNSSIPSSSLQNPPAFSYSLPGKYNIRLVVNERMPSQSNICKEIVSVSPPKASVTGDTSICVGGTISFITASNPGSTFFWTGPNGYISTNQNVNIPDADIRNEGLYTLIPFVNGCSGPAISKNVTIFSNAFKPDITGDTAVCVGGTINLATISIPGSSYFWVGPNNFTSSNQNISIQNADTKNIGLYTLVVSKNGCSSLLASKNVNIYSSTYKPDITGDTSVCVGGTINLSTVSMPGNIYLWTGPAGYNASNQSISIPKENTGNAGLYTLTVTNNACISITSGKKISVYHISLTPEIAGDTAVCVGRSINLCTASIPGNTYLWTGPNGFTSSNRELSISKSNISNSGLYTLVETQNNCLSYAAYKNVLVLHEPNVNLGQDTAVCPGNTLLLDAENEECSYEWNTGDISQTLLVLNPGKYSVIVSNGLCSASNDILVEGCAADLWLPNVFTPNFDGINDRFRPVHMGTVLTYKIFIFNRWGQQLFESTELYPGWDGYYNGNPCPGGVYYFLIQYTLGIDPSIKIREKRGAVTLLR